MGMGIDRVPGTLYDFRRSPYGSSVHPSSGNVGPVNYEKEMLYQR